MSDALSWVQKHVGLMNAALGIFVTYTGLKTITMLGDLTNALKALRAASITTALITAAPAALPTLGIAALTGALGYGAYKLFSKPDPNTGDVPNFSPNDLATWRTPNPPKATPPQSKSLVRIVFENAPIGMRVVEENSSFKDLAVELGWNNGRAF